MYKYKNINTNVYRYLIQNKKNKITSFLWTLMYCYKL